MKKTIIDWVAFGRSHKTHNKSSHYLKRKEVMKDTFITIIVPPLVVYRFKTNHILRTKKALFRLGKI